MKESREGKNPHIGKLQIIKEKEDLKISQRAENLPTMKKNELMLDFWTVPMDVEYYFPMLRERKKSCQPRFMYPSKLSFKRKEKLNNFSDKQK